jgi:hypothetical protein
MDPLMDSSMDPPMDPLGHRPLESGLALRTHMDPLWTHYYGPYMDPLWTLWTLYGLIGNRLESATPTRRRAR